MRWEDDFSNNRAPTFRNDVTLSGNVCFAALRLRAKIAQTDNPTNVSLGNQGDSDSDPAC